MARDSIITTVFNRPVQVLRNTFSQLAQNNLKDTEVIVVDDGSDLHNYRAEYFYEWINENRDCDFKYIRINTLEDRPGTYNINGYNNPAYAWNTALEAAQGERIMMLVSDVMLQPDIIQRARRCKNRVWMPSVIDINSYPALYLGPRRVTPYGWFMSWRREDAGEIRQDEEYLKGIAFEDNDFSARLCLAVKSVTIELGAAAFHQSHPQVAYSDGLKGHDINERYTCKKWSGIPWSGLSNDPLRVQRYINSSELRLTVTRKSAEQQKLSEDHAFV